MEGSVGDAYGPPRHHLLGPGSGRLPGVRLWFGSVVAALSRRRVPRRRERRPPKSHRKARERAWPEGPRDAPAPVLTHAHPATPARTHTHTYTHTHKYPLHPHTHAHTLSLPLPLARTLSRALAHAGPQCNDRCRLGCPPASAGLTAPSLALGGGSRERGGDCGGQVSSLVWTF